MNALKKIENFFYTSETWKFLSVIAIISVFKTGIWYIPNLSMSLEIAKNPFSNPFADPNAHYLLWSWLGPFIAWLIGVKRDWQIFVFYFVFSVAFTGLFVKTIFQLLPGEKARVSILIFSALPVSATAYFWVSPDSITLFLMMLSLAAPNRLVVTLLCGALLGMQHFEQAVISAFVLFVTLLFSERRDYITNYSKKFAAVLFLGTIIGKLTLLVIFDFYGIAVNSGRLYWLEHHLYILLNQFYYRFHYTIWSVLGLGWLVAFKYADFGKKTVPFFVALFSTCAILLPLSGDQTRVLAIVTFPLISAYWLLNNEFISTFSKKETSLLFLAWVIVPWGWVWGSTPKWSVFPYDVVFCINKIFGLLSVPQNPALWPFQ